MSAKSISPCTAFPRPIRRLGNMPLSLLMCFALLMNLLKTTGHDRQRVLETAVLAVVAVFAAFAGKRGGALFRARADKPLMLFFLLGLGGSALAFAPGLALFEVAAFFLLYLFALLIAREIAAGGNDSLLLLLQAVACICALHAVQFLVTYGVKMSLGASLYVDDFTLGFSNIRFFNHMQTAILPLLILLCCITPKTSRLRLLWWGLSAYWWMAIFATSGRGTLSGMLAGWVAVGLLRRRLARPYLKSAGISILLGLLAYFIFLVAIPYLAGGSAFGAFGAAIDRTAADPASGRGILWQRALTLIMQHPLLGVGPMHFAHNAGDLQIGAHPHDWIMQIASEWGLPAFLCLCTALLLAGHALLRAGKGLAAEDTLNQNICSALVAGGATILVDGLVSGLFVMPQSQLAIALFLGCAIGWYRANAGPIQGEVGSSRLQRAGTRLLAIVAAACLLNAVWPDAAARFRGDALRPSQASLNPGTTWPRLWHAGYF
jgi:putative inorganic carbon (HCO3(-)) transporter